MKSLLQFCKLSSLSLKLCINSYQYFQNYLFQRQRDVYFVVVFLSICFKQIETITIKDILTLDSSLIRIPRDSKYASRYDSRTESSDKGLKPEETSDVSNSASLGKRCVRCENGYLDRNPYDRNRYNFDDRNKDYDRYDDRYYERDRYYDRDRYGSDR